MGVAINLFSVNCYGNIVDSFVSGGNCGHFWLCLWLCQVHTKCKIKHADFDGNIAHFSTVWKYIAHFSPYIKV